MSAITPPRTAAFEVCPLDAVPVGGGVAALIAGHQVALLRDDDGTVHAIDNRDPWTGANVLSRGLLGSSAGRRTVASPLRKQRFDLTSGMCVEDPTVHVRVHTATVVNGQIHVAVQLGPDVAHDASVTPP